MVKFAHLIPLFPFAAFAVNILFGRRLKKASALVSIGASVAALAIAVMAYIGNAFGGEGSYTVGRWISFNGFALDFGVIIDPLSCMMLLVVTVVGTLIQVYSIGYMHDDKRYSRFFAYMSLFMGSMLGLLLSDNFVMLYIFWEGVGLCSYLLISFWFERPAAARAGMKAFITTRIGDTGLLIGILLLFFTTKTLYFKDLAGLGINDATLTVIALLIFCGAVGKSAQFPLHVWLPDAMEGPTPVSALIHAATMVAAGVYLVARTYGLFLTQHTSLIWVAYIGAITALMAATIATVNNDIKRILAYSTISQLGFMMLALGVGGYEGGTFHLMTHAFFKALLFLCAGSVIHAVHTQDIFKMGGLLGKMKATGWTFIIGGLAIAGVPPFSGFWSKDEILSEILKGGHPVLFGVAALTSLLTAFYMFRLIFVVLFGKPRSELHAHESPAVMTVPLCILAAFAAFAGFFRPVKFEFLTMGVSIAISLTGIGAAYVFYILDNKLLPASLRSRFAFLYKLVSNKYYVDEIYGALIIRPCMRLADIASGFDSKVVDGAVNMAAYLSLTAGKVQSWFDLYIVDGIVNMTANVTWLCSAILRRFQTGFVQNYILIAFFGLAIMIFIKLIGGR
ncbi:MAG: NADH-quinone oxidoreductase subunit L [Candidatus Omnitrophica bacterium]|nr:NADH-quinone oxidoreductase subunit L [Candidatus Omnitrophota bacterium]